MSEQASGDIETWRHEMAARIRKHVAESACRLNPDAKIVAALTEGLVKRRAKFGDFYCPCRILTGKAETDRGNVCPCSSHEAEIAETGMCHCHLFVGEKRA